MAKSKIEVLSAGTKLAYAVETVAGTMPTTATHIPNIKEIPDFSAEPDQIEVTDLGDTKYKRFIPGLIDLSGASGYTANETPFLTAAWKQMCEAYKAAKASGLAMWFYIITPGLQTAAFPGIPSDLAVSGRTVNNVVEINCSITVNGEIVRTDEEITVNEPTIE